MNPLSTVLQEEREECTWCFDKHSKADMHRIRNTVSGALHPATACMVHKLLFDSKRTVLAAVDTVIGSIGTGPSVDGTGSEYDKGYWGAVQDMRGILKAALETK